MRKRGLFQIHLAASPLKRLLQQQPVVYNPNDMMLRKIAFIFILLAVTGLLPAADEITFKRINPQPGETDNESFDMQMTMKLNVTLNGKVVKSGDETSRQVYTRKWTALASNAEAATKIRVSYAVPEQPAAEKARPPAKKQVSGKTFIVEFKDGALVVTREDGSKPLPNEAVILKRDCKSLGKPDPFSQFLNGKTVKLGERLDPPPEVLAEMMDVKDEFDVEKVSMTLKAVRQEAGLECAVFETELAMNNRAADPKVSMSVKGEAGLGSDATLIFMKLSGPVTMSGNKTRGEDKVSMEGAGMFQTAITHRHSQDAPAATGQ